MNYYGSQLWYNARNNEDKIAIRINPSAIKALTDLLEKAHLNYYGCDNGKLAKISINSDDLDIVKSLVGETIAQNMKVERLKNAYIPPENNVFGTIDYKYIARKSKRYINGETDIEQKAILRTAELLTRQGIKFSGKIYDNKVTLTLYEQDLEKANELYSSVRSVLQEITETSHHSSFERKMSKIVESLNEVGFPNSYLEKNIPLVKIFTGFENVDYYDYSCYLNPNYTDEQNTDIAERLSEVYASGGFDLLQPSKAERDLLEVKIRYDVDIQLRAYLAEHKFDLSQEQAIRNIVEKEKGVNFLLGQIDETFNSDEIERLYTLYLSAVKSEKPSDIIDVINDFIESHYKNLYRQDIPDPQHTPTLPYTDAFFVDKKSERIKWIYFNPDSDSGGQLITNFITFKELLIANEFTTTPEEFFDYIGQSCRQTVADLGTDDFDDMAVEFAQNPLFTECSAKTMESLIDSALSSNTAFLSRSDISSFLLDKLMNDYELRDIFRSNNAVFEKSVLKKADKFMADLELNKERIQGYSRIDVLTFCSEYNHPTYLKNIKTEILSPVIEDIRTAFAQLEEAKEKAHDTGIPFVDKFVDGDYEFDPYVYDGSMTPEDFKKAQELNLNQERLEENELVPPDADTTDIKYDSLEFSFSDRENPAFTKENDIYINNFTESDLLHNFVLDTEIIKGQKISFALANAVVEYLDEKQHTERNNPDIENSGWYKKTDFFINAVVGDEEFNYEGRFDIGDGKGSGGGSIIDHIREFAQWQLENNPWKSDDATLNGYKRNLEILVPFLETNAELTPQEQEIFEHFKLENPIRISGIEKSQEDEHTVPDLPQMSENTHNSKAKFAVNTSKSQNKSKATVTNVWSDFHYFEGEGQIFSVSEIDRLMKLYDDEIADIKREFAENGDYYPSSSMEFTINLPDGRTIEEQRELGNGSGGLIDFLLLQGDKYNAVIPILETQIEQEKTKSSTKKQKPIENQFAQLPLTANERPEQQKLTEEATRQTDNKQSLQGNSENVSQSETQVRSQAEIVYTQEIKKYDYHITDSHIGEGTPSERFNNNIEAIKTLKNIESENRLAIPEEQEKLAKYVGWGGLANYFNKKHPKFCVLKNLLTEDEFKAARASTLTAFYTPPVVMQAMYKALGNTGFIKGEVLEPSCGIGNFIGTIPENMQESNVHAVELDSISGRIAKQLYQTADIKITGFEKTRFNDNAFDVAIGNVPFGEIKVRDKRYDQYNWRIHNYFFAKTLDKVRPGGVVAFITSRYTLDSKSSSFREYLAERADLLGAVRLPNNTFSKAAGTDVVSDIIFLQKRNNPPEITPEWVHTADNKDGFTINTYFVNNPDMILGNLAECSSTYGRTDITVNPLEGTDFAEQLDKAVENIEGSIPERKLEEADKSVEDIKTTDSTVPENLRNYSFYVNDIDNKVYFKENDDGFLWKRGAESKNYTDRAKAFIALRDCTREILDAMVNDCSDEELHILQNKLNTLYDDFYRKYGLVHGRYNKSLFKNDISYQLVAALESKYNDKELIAKSDLFTKRTIKPPEFVTSVDTAQEALTISLAEKGIVDLDFMAELYENDKETIINELKGRIYPVPELSTDDYIVYQDSSEYLSGDIRQKIDSAKRAAETNPMLYTSNIKALESILPTPLKAGDIDVKIGAAWIDPIYYQQFMYEKFNTPNDNRADKKTPLGRGRNKIELSYSKTGNSYHIDNKSIDQSLFVTKTYGTKHSRANAYFIFENMLNLRDTKIYKTVYDNYGDEKRVIDTEATKIAANKADKIKKEFKEWIFQDPKRRETLVKKYNDMYNSIRPREYDGSGLTFPGMNAEIELRPHQKNAIAHALYGGNTLFAHSVGAGKTYEMIATAMESKRLGLCSKSLMVVPNHLTEQIGDDFQKLYPNANVLVATKADFTKQNRRYLVSKIATGDYDAVIIGHSQLGKIPLSKEKQIEYIQEEIEELIEAISEMKSADDKSFSVKDAEKRKDNLEKQLVDLQTQKDDVVTFEELGIDKIFVDEAHEFKNLFTPTKLNNVSGVSHSASQKASDLYMKCRYLDEKTGGRGVTFATGTPISNSVTELFTMQRYLQHDLLKEKNLSHFDQWITLFGEQVIDYQIDPTGKKFKHKTRIANYSNMTELMSMFKCTADIKTSEMMNLDVPECETHIINVDATELQQDLVNELSVRADYVESGVVEPEEDNFLKITGDGRKVGLDPRLIDPNLEDNPNTKLNQCVRNVLKIHKDTEKEKLTQLIFCDLGVPKANANTEQGENSNDKENVSIAEQESFEDTGNFCIYDDIKKKLIDGGVPVNEIAFIHDAKTDKAKAELFEKCRKGEIRVLLGSTPKMGTGTNIQDKLVALHDLDVPWRPSDLEQRCGRMVRQGNQNKNVHLYRYVTKGTFDAYSYQTLENKQRYISQIYKNQNQRTCQDVDQQSLTYAEIKTLCTGDERLKELMMLDNDVSTLTAMKRDHTNTVYEMQDKITKFDEYQNIISNYISGVTKDIQICSSLPKDKETGNIKFMLDVNGIKYTDKTVAAKALEKVCINAQSELNKGEEFNLCTMHGFPVSLKFSPAADELIATVSGSAKYTIPFTLASFPTNIKRLCNVFDGMVQHLSDKQDELARMKIEIQEAQKIVSAPFEREQELTDKTKRRNSLKNELQTEANERAKEPINKTFYFSVANMRKNAQKCRDEGSTKNVKSKNPQSLED